MPARKISFPYNRVQPEELFGRDATRASSDVKKKKKKKIDTNELPLISRKWFSAWEWLPCEIVWGKRTRAEMVCRVGGKGYLGESYWNRIHTLCLSSLFIFIFIFFCFLFLIPFSNVGEVNLLRLQSLDPWLSIVSCLYNLNQLFCLLWL